MKFISVIIPAYNNPSGVLDTIKSLVNQEYSNYEIIPVDNNSSDETPAVINQCAEQHPTLIRPTEERDTQSSYAARNAGIEHAHGDLLVFIDADMTAPKNWLQCIAAEFENTNVDYLGYDIQLHVPEAEDGLWGWYDQIMGLPAHYHFAEHQFVPTACLAVRNSVFDAVGRFDERLTSSGDREFGHRVRDNPDLTMAFSNDIVVFHPARTSFKEHYKKALRIGQGLVQVGKTSKRPEDACSVLSDLLDHLLPPNPLRIYERGKARDLLPYQYALLYAMDLLIRYVRLYGALTYYINQKTGSE